MPKTVKDMVGEANAAVERISMDEAQKMIAAGALVLDVRDGAELQASGKIKGAVNVPRGMLEFNADPAAPAHNPELQTDRPVLVYCALGGRAALSGKLLKDMGYTKVYNLGGFKEWADAGGEVEGA